MGREHCYQRQGPSIAITVVERSLRCQVFFWEEIVCLGEKFGMGKFHCKYSLRDEDMRMVWR